jgi:hypothetical protein
MNQENKTAREKRQEKQCVKYKHQFWEKLSNGREYSWCSLIDKSTGKVFEDLKMILYEWENIKT